jgi:hypothetical protein
MSADLPGFVSFRVVSCRVVSFSFTRQLYLWGFVRVSSGPDAGAFWHELFLDGHDQLLRYMRRVGAPQGAKEDRRKTKHRFGADPDFYAMEPLRRISHPSSTRTTSEG